MNPELEITEIAVRALREGLPALLFENVEGSHYPVAINLLASDKRVEIALGRHPEELGEEIAAFAEEILPPSPSAMWRNRKMLLRLKNTIPKRVRRPAVTRNFQPEVRLSELPILKCWPEDGGRFITLPLVISRSPSSGKPNVGMYRMQMFGESMTGMHMQIQKGSGFHYYEAEKNGADLPMAVAIGGDPLLTISAITPLPEGVDELAFSGFIRGARTRVFSTKSGITAPAEADFLLEGFVPAQKRRLEGPFGDHFGHYSEAAQFPVFKISRLHYRNNPIYAATIVGRPPMEDRYIGDASQLLVGKLIRTVHGEVKDIWAYYESGFHNLLVVSVESRYEREAVKTALGILGQGQLSLTKTLVCVSEDVNPRDPGEVLDAIRRNFLSDTDFRLIERTSQDTLDFTGESMNKGSKMVIDATEKYRNGERNHEIPEIAKEDLPLGVSEHRVLRGALLVVKVTGNGKKIVSEIVANPKLQGLKIAVAVSEDINIWDKVELLWGIFTRFDCARDVVFSKLELDGILLRRSGLMGVDATWKKNYQQPLEMDTDIKKKVDSKWQAYWK